jgi:hypothetical protein
MYEMRGKRRAAQRHVRVGRVTPCVRARVCVCVRVRVCVCVYVCVCQVGVLQEEVRLFEDQGALDGGEAGDDVIKVC